MIPDETDTIVAHATAVGAGTRGVVRVSGPAALSLLGALVEDNFEALSGPCRLGLAVTIELHGAPRSLPVDAWVWPDARSYTHQPTVELHTVAAKPVTDALVRACCRHGARLAQPGEFTLRAFLSGRIDLTQAEAVLGVIDASSESALNTALEQLAGGLSTPLHRLREDLTQLLAELEAGLDFVEEEDIRFVEPEQLTQRLQAALGVLSDAVQQASRRDEGQTLPSVVLVGPPNAGKSRLFNAIRQRWSADQHPGRQPIDALVSGRAGTTRDTLTATIDYQGVHFRLLDTAGIVVAPRDAIDALAMGHTDASLQGATVVLRCAAIGETPPETTSGELLVTTKCDLAPHDLGAEGLATSAATGDGVEELLAAVAKRLAEAESATRASLSAGVSARCREALANSEQALARALELAPTGADELVAEELRQALAALGDVVGATATDDLLDRIFGQFCIGK